jgi:hypothetical protein
MRTLVWLLVLGCGAEGDRTEAPDRLVPTGGDTDTSCDVMRWWGQDLDGDGFGANEVLACESPGPGWTEQLGDCDDTDPRKNVAEVCDPDDYDEDCDGAADDADADAPRWYRDRDGDGWGDEGRSVTGCEQPSAYAASSGDCNDRDANVFPGAPEACAYDGIDEDCDGTPASYVDEDGDGFGIFEVTDCAQPRGPASGDCDDADPALNPGAEEICADGIDQDCDGNAGPCGGVEGTWDMGAHRPYVEGGLEDVGDFDGDGSTDLLVLSDAHAMAVRVGPFDRSTAPGGGLAVTIRSAEADLRSGLLADTNGDGLDDLVVSSSEGYDNTAWIDTTTRSGTTTITSAGARFREARAVAAIDSDADGVDEIALWDTASAELWFVADAPDGEWTAADHAFAKLGTGTWYVADLGDVDGDGLPDLAWHGSAGVDVAYGPLTGEVLGDHTVTSTADAGGSPLAVGDLDGDGRRDLGVHTDAPSWRDHCADVPETELWLFQAPFPGSVTDADASIVASGVQVIGEAGDLDADGAGELFLQGGSWCEGYSGRGWILTGPFAGEISEGSTAIAEMEWRGYGDGGAHQVGHGDLDADGRADLVVGGSDETHLFFGGPGL